MSARDFLIEIGTEELPSAAVLGLSTALGASLIGAFATQGLAHGAVSTYGTPRRIAVLVRRLAARAADTAIARRGPPVSAAFDAAGAPTRAALAFAESCGVAVAELGRIAEAKGEFLHYATTRPGAPVTALLPDIVAQAVAQLPLAKRMRWGSSDIEFARPVHWIVLLYGADIVPATVLGIGAGRTTFGHRFMAPRALSLSNASAYARRLERSGRVIADFADRRERIRAGVTELAAREGGTPVMSDALLDEVTSLVEWPVPLCAGFDARFLDLPPEVLIATLQGHQRYFAIRDARGALSNRFITVANLESTDPSQVVAGNERVVGPRLSDAAFFWNQDRAQTLRSRRAALAAVTFQAQLGSYLDKAERSAALAEFLAPAFGAEAVTAADAMGLAKCDLLTGLVGEFPELQGTMGGYYAGHDGEAEAIATAIAEHYQPRFAGDALPATALGRVLSVADKLDTIAGIFAIGQKPSGTRDPYGLRRAALGVLRILIECRVDVDLVGAIELAAARAAGDRDARPAPGAPKAQLAGAPAVAREVYDYMLERLRAYYGENGSGVTPEMFDAVLDRRPRSALDFDRRLQALVEFLKLPDAPALAAANKRIANILRKAEEGGEPLSLEVDRSLLVEAEERALGEALADARGVVADALSRYEYTAALTRLAQLRGTVDAFFDKVLVNAPDAQLRRARLALLGSLRALFLSTADLSRLPG